MKAEDILAFAIDRASAINTYWNLFIGVATTLVGIMASGKEFTCSPKLKKFLSTAFIVFAASNLLAILRLGALRETLLRMLPQNVTEGPDLIKYLSPAPPFVYICFHIVLDLLVLAAIWHVNWREASKNVDS